MENKFTQEVGEDLQITLARILKEMLEDPEQRSGSVLREAREFLKNQGINHVVGNPRKMQEANAELVKALEGFSESNITKLHHG